MNPIVIPFKTDPTDIVDELTSNAVRDMLAKSDALDLAAIRIAVGGVSSGEARFGGITRDTLYDAMRIMGNGHTVG